LVPKSKKQVTAKRLSGKVPSQGISKKSLLEIESVSDEGVDEAVDMEGEAEVDVVADVDAESEDAAEGEAETGSEDAAEGEAEVDAESETEVEDSSESDAEAELDAEVEDLETSLIQVDAAAEAEAESGLDIDADAEVDAEALADAEADAEADLDADLAAWQGSDASDLLGITVDNTVDAGYTDAVDMSVDMEQHLDSVDHDWAEWHSLLEASDCPTCQNNGRTLNHPVVYNNNNPGNSLDKEVYERQHNAVNYLIKPVAQQLSIRERELQNANVAAQEAADAHQRFAEFVDQHSTMPLVPRD